jgi:hypothetical protein
MQTFPNAGDVEINNRAKQLSIFGLRLPVVERLPRGVPRKCSPTLFTLIVADTEHYGAATFTKLAHQQLNGANAKLVRTPTKLVRGWWITAPDYADEEPV